MQGLIKKTQKTPKAELDLALKRKREFQLMDTIMEERKPRSAKALDTLDDYLDSLGKRAEFEAVAIKGVLAWQIEAAMKDQKLSRNQLAERMHTSRSQLNRLLDPKDGNVTIATLQRAAEMVGRKVQLELI